MNGMKSKPRVCWKKKGKKKAALGYFYQQTLSHQSNDILFASLFKERKE